MKKMLQIIFTSFLVFIIAGCDDSPEINGENYDSYQDSAKFIIDSANYKDEPYIKYAISYIFIETFEEVMDQNITNQLYVKLSLSNEPEVINKKQEMLTLFLKNIDGKSQKELIEKGRHIINEDNYSRYKPYLKIMP